MTAGRDVSPKTIISQSKRLLGLAVWISVIVVALGSSLAKAAPFTAREEAVPFKQPNGGVLKLDTLVLIPDNPGRFPLAVVSHGSPRNSFVRARMSPGNMIETGKWLAQQGFAVAIPMRRGYGRSQGDWAEGFGACQNPDYTWAGRASAQDIEAVVSYMRSQPYVDAARVVLVGHSAGGWGSIAAASENLPGVVAVVAFAPGRGSLAPDEVCGGHALVAAAGQFGTTTHIPTLWIYSENDHFFSPKLARDVFDAFHATALGAAEFVESPSCSNDGHMLISRCPDAWHASVAAFLHRVVSAK